jgi:hypothetical protein
MNEKILGDVVEIMRIDFREPRISAETDVYLDLRLTADDLAELLERLDTRFGVQIDLNIQNHIPCDFGLTAQLGLIAPSLARRRYKRHFQSLTVAHLADLIAKAEESCSRG